MSQDDDDDDELLPRKKAAKLIGMSPRFLEVAAVNGDGPPMIKIGRSVRYMRRDLREFVEARRITSTSMRPSPHGGSKKK